MKKKSSLLAVLFLAVSGVQAGSPVIELIDIPTAEVLDRYGFDASFRFYTDGGMLTKTHFGVFPRLNVGFNLDAEGFVGNQSVDVNKPTLNVRFRFFDGQRNLPALALGYDGQGLFYNNDTDKYNQREKGLFLVGSGEIIVPDLSLHAGINMYDFSDDYIYGFMGESYRLRLDVADGVRYELLQQDPRRVWLRFIGGRAAGSAVLEGDNVIHRVRLVQRRHSTDVIVELGGAALSNEVYFDQSEKKLVIDVQRQELQLVARETPPAQASLPKPAPVVVPVPAARVDVAVKRVQPKPVADTRIRTIVIDAGHGGHDAGAIGVRGTYEKDINLKVARMLADRLSKEKNLRVILTRDSDEFIPLSTRTQIANDARADLFVSIHCNSSLSSKHTGLELYVLSPSATDEAAEAVARLENSVIALESKKGQKTDKLSTLLASMAVNNYINESLECATLLGRAMKTHASVDNSAVKEANFYVLRGAQMPSVLVELEYVSNPISELKLRSSRYQSQLAKAIATGVLDADKRFRKKQESMAARNGGAASEQ